MKKNIYLIGFMILLSFLLTIFNYIGILNNNILNIFKIIIVTTTFFLNGFIVGKKVNKKGYIYGLEAGGILLIIFIILDLVFKVKFSLKLIIYYLLLLLLSILGSIIGINKKK